MKRTLAILLTFVFLAATLIIPAVAAPGEPEYAKILKANEGDVNMGNAEKDAVFNTATPIIIDRHNGIDGEIATGIAWMVWTDTAYYVYAEVTDPTVYDNEQKDSAWETDSFEIFIDMDGSSEAGSLAPGANDGVRAMQFRVDRNGIPSSYPSDGDWGSQFIVGADVNADMFQWAARQYSGGYAVKFRVASLGAPKAGELGLQFQINDRDEFGGGIEGQPTRQGYGTESDSWDVFAYGFVTLIDEPAIPAADPEPAGDDGKEADEPAPAAEPAARPASPRTGDAGMIAIIALMAIAAAGIVVLRRKASR